MMKITVLQLLMIAVSFLLGPANGQDTCTFGDSLSPLTSSTMTGTLFLDIDHPAPCNGTVTAWHICYFHPSNIFSFVDFSAIFQVWRPIEGTVFYQRVFQSSLTAKVLNFDDSEQYICRDIDSAILVDHTVNNGDIYGVYIPEVNGLRLVSAGFSQANRLQFINVARNISSVTTSENAQLLTGLELLMTADIDTTLPPAIPTTAVIGSTTELIDYVTDRITNQTNSRPNSTPESAEDPSSIVEVAVGVGVATLGMFAILIVVLMTMILSVKHFHSILNKAGTSPNNPLYNDNASTCTVRLDTDNVMAGLVAIDTEIAPRYASVESDLTITALKRRTGITDTQLDFEIIEHDLYALAGCFDNVETYLCNLGLTPGQQTDIKDLAVRCSTQLAMSEALKLWRAPNPLTATFRALLTILLDLRSGDVAVRVCHYVADKVVPQ